MNPSSPIFIGIDPSGGRSPFNYAILDQDCSLQELRAGDVEDVLAIIRGQKAAIVAVNAPSSPNMGFVRTKMEKQARTASSHLRGLEMRLAEQILREHGINLSPTPARKELCPAWMQMGFALYQELSKEGYEPYPAAETSRHWLETHPHAAFCTLLERVPLPKPTLEGRLQRQSVLHTRGLEIKDPMDFFEEITRHKLLVGNLPMEFIYLPEELDALAAAYVAFLSGTQPDQVIAVGNEQEGRVVLPCNKLLDHYS